jgi:hypothetical protein
VSDLEPFEPDETVEGEEVERSFPVRRRPRGLGEATRRVPEGVPGVRALPRPERNPQSGEGRGGLRQKCRADRALEPPVRRRRQSLQRWTNKQEEFRQEGLANAKVVAASLARLEEAS